MVSPQEVIIFIFLLTDSFEGSVPKSQGKHNNFFSKLMSNRVQRKITNISFDFLEQIE
jgi:hypothetical protein